MNSELIEKILIAALVHLRSPPQQYKLYMYRIAHNGAGVIYVHFDFADERNDHDKWISTIMVNAVTIGMTQDQIMNLSTRSIVIAE